MFCTHRYTCEVAVDGTYPVETRGLFASGVAL